MYRHVVLRPASSGAKDFLRRIGIPSAQDVAPKPEEEVGVPFTAIDDAHRALFLAEYRLFVRHFPSRAAYPFRFYADPAGTDTRTAYCMLGRSERGVAMRVVPGGNGFLFPQPHLLRTAFRHEGRHLETGRGDADRGFMVAAEMEIDACIARIEGHSVTPLGHALAPLNDASDAYPSFVCEGAMPEDDDGPELTLEDL